MSDIHFVTLLPDQVSRNWDIIRPGIDKSLPPIVDQEDANRMADILASIMSGRLKVHCFCWIREKGLLEIAVFMVTAEVEIIESRYKSLLVFSTFGIRQAGPDDWKEGFRLLKLYAKGVGCSNILAYSNVNSVITMCKGLGWNTDYRVMSHSVD